MSLASLATSVPLPIANPTSAFFKAGASFTPSPVIPTTNPISCDILTNLLLSCGSARAIIFILGNKLFNSVSLFCSSSLLVNTKSLLFCNNFTSLPIETAVFLLSPVIIIVLIPAFFTNFTPSIASFLTSSFIDTSPINVKFSKRSVLLVASAITLIPDSVFLSIISSICFLLIALIFPVSSYEFIQLGIIFSGAPLTNIIDLSLYIFTIEYLFLLSNGTVDKILYFFSLFVFINSNNALSVIFPPIAICFLSSNVLALLYILEVLINS